MGGHKELLWGARPSLANPGATALHYSRLRGIHIGVYIKLFKPLLNLNNLMKKDDHITIYEDYAK